jgi:aminoglycoside 6'-N-acetyltransferase
VPSVQLVTFDPTRDLSMLAAWLHRPHVARWWGDPDQALSAVHQHSVVTEALIELDAQPVGYLCWQRPPQDELARAGLSDLPRDLVDVDILIGEPDALGQGVGPEALSQLLAKLRADGVQVVGLAAATANLRALKAYDKAGFRLFRDFHEAGQDMRYLVKTLNTAV